MRHFLFAFVFLMFNHVALAQNGMPAEYSVLIKQADSLYKVKDFKNSAQVYSLAFKSMGWKGTSIDRYNAACSWALAGVPDSSFANLERIASRGNYSNYDHLMKDTDLFSLHGDKRWQPLVKRVLENKEKMEANYNKDLIKELDSLVGKDQKWRHYSTRFKNNQMGNDTTSLPYIHRNLRMTDSLNYFHLQTIFKKYGFPNFDIVGQQGTNNFWLLMQHQDSHPEFQEEVLLKMKAQVDKGKASGIDYAYLLDRVKVNTGKLQVYGTQMKLNAAATSYEPQPVIDPEKLNERRKSVGLDSIESYTQTMNKRFFGTLKKNE